MIKKIKEHYLIYIDLLMIALGIIGLVGGLLVSLCFPSFVWIDLPFLIIYAWLLYLCYQKNLLQLKLKLNIVLGMILFVLLSFCFEDFIELMNNLKEVIEKDYFLNFTELVETSSTVLPVFVLLIIGIPICYLIVSFLCRKSKSLLKLLICLIVYVFPALIWHPFCALTSYCFILFIGYEFIFGYTLQHQKGQQFLRTIVIVELIVLMLFSGLILQPNPLFDEKVSYVMTHISQWIDAQNITGTKMTIDGHLPTNSIQLGNSVALEVTSTEPISTYLRGYSLARYENNEWYEVSEDFPAVNSNNLSSRWVSQYINGRTITMTVKSKKATVYQFVPYYTKMQGDEINDSYYQNNSSESMTVLPTYPDISTFYELYYYNLSGYDQYTDYVKNHYLDVPESLKLQLMDYIETYSYMTPTFMKYSLDEQEMVEIVKSILAENTSYSLNTGALPAGKDFVEYFLFENRKGSCTHYATAAALMLRCLDIPTRFVQGYILKELDFNGGNTAQVRSHRSHAWIEIYIDGKGWIPVEVTPSTTGYDADLVSIAEMLDDEMENQTNQTSQTPVQANKTPQEQADNNQTIHQDDKNDVIEFLQKYSQYFINAGIFIGFIVVYRILSTHWLQIKLRKQNSNQKIKLYYRRMLRLLRFGGVIDDKAIELANKAKFSQHVITDTEVIEMHDQYHKLVNDIDKSLKWYHKIIYRILGYK